MLDGFTVLSGLVLLVTLTVLIAAHEYGHYLFARMFGMEVEAFALMVGGVRKTNLADRLEKPLVSGWIVAGVMAGLIALWDLTVRFSKTLPFDSLPLLLVLQVGVVLVVPLWIASRLAALYHVPFTKISKNYVTAWLVWFVAATAFGITKNMALTGFIALLAPVSALALIFTYYIPVLSNKQEEDKYGEGQIQIDGETVPIEFRPVVSRVSKSGTEFSLLVLPFGGFAKIKGMQPREDGSEVNIPGGFFSKAPWKRILVLFAGPLFSVLAGVILLAGIFTTYGRPERTKEAILGHVGTKTAAEKAGLKEGDRVLAINGNKVRTFFEMRQLVVPRGGETIQLTVQRGSQIKHLSVALEKPIEKTPMLDQDLEETSELRYQAKMGVDAKIIKKKLPLGEAVVEAFKQPVKDFLAIVNGIATKPSQLKDNMGGIATVAAATDSAVRSQEFDAVIGLAALLSISLGIFNLLPFYPLDGGQIVVAFVEMFTRGKRLSLKVQNTFSLIGISLIGMLVLFVVVNDTKRLSGADKAPEKKPPVQTTPAGGPKTKPVDAVPK